MLSLIAISSVSFPPMTRFQAQPCPVVADGIFDNRGLVVTDTNRASSQRLGVSDFGIVLTNHTTLEGQIFDIFIK
jgi:hypothetical protein